MMPKLFCCSDIHSAYTPWMKALDEAGFDENNPEHHIVVCGDLFDRMDESQQVYDFVMDMLDKGKMTYIKGNHESLMEDLLQRGHAQSHDYSNGTYKTLLDLAPDAQYVYQAIYAVREKLKLLFDNTVDYLETKRYIFVHSFVPMICNDNLPKYYIKNRKFEKDTYWREADAYAWEDARWGNPYELAEKGLLPDKTLVFGHFHTSWPRHKYDGKPEFGDDADFSVYYGDGYIALDSCVAYSGKLNCLVLEDEFLK